MNLKEIIPAKVEVTLERLDRPLVLNLLTLEDNVWLEQNYPGEELQKVYTEPRIKDILKILCRILDVESKRYLAKIEIIEIDDYGLETPLKGASLADKLFKIVGDGEMALIISGIFEIRTRSNDIVMKLSEKYAAQKKREEMTKELLGNPSSTSSPVSTDSPLTK